jgi:membrane protein
MVGKMRGTLAQSRLVRRLLAARERFRADDLGTMAAALAFQAFLSLFPTLLLALSVAGFLLAGDPADWLRRFFDAMPGVGPLLGENLDAIVKARGGLGLVALAGVAWAASGLTGRASDALARIFRLQGRNLVRRRVRSLLALLVLGAALLAALLASGTIAAVRAEGWWEVPLRVLTLAAVAGLEFVFFLGTYAALTPSGGPPVRAHLPGAIVMTAGWEVLKLVGGVLVATVVTRSSALYGTIGAIFGLLVFLRAGASLYLAGAELSALLAETRAASTGVTSP